MCNLLTNTLHSESGGVVTKAKSRHKHPRAFTLTHLGAHRRKHDRGK